MKDVIIEKDASGCPRAAFLLGRAGRQEFVAEVDEVDGLDEMDAAGEREEWKARGGYERCLTRAETAQV